MVVLPEGTVIPPLPYLLTLLVLVIAVSVALFQQDPPVTEYTVVALVPWMATGGALHVLAVTTIANPLIVPFLEAPAVYATTFILFGATWRIALDLPTTSDPTPSRAWLVGASGAAVLSVVTIGILSAAALRGNLALGWPLASLVASIILTIVLWGGFRSISPQAASTARWVGVVVLFAHVFDGVTTAIGVDVLGAGERSPIPLLIMDLAAQFPLAETIGVGWAFVVVKVILAGGVVWLFEEYIREAPRQAYFLLSLIAAVGLGPGMHNLLLFIISG